MPNDARLSDADLADRLAALPDWTREGDRLVRSYEFTDFNEAFGFLCRVALLAERRDHHPDIHNSYKRVRIELTSHDAGGITERDVALALAIDRLD